MTHARWGAAQWQSAILQIRPTPTDLGFDAHVFDNDDVFRLLKAAVKSEGGQTVFAKRHRMNRVYVNMVLKCKRPVGDSIARALGLRKVYIAE